jgi:hypothetical protein
LWRRQVQARPFSAFFGAYFNADRSWYKDFPIVDDRNYEAILRAAGST